MGIEPTSSAWKAEVLPLNYTRPVKTTWLAICSTQPSLASRAQKAVFSGLFPANKTTERHLSFDCCPPHYVLSLASNYPTCKMVEGGGFEPPKA